MRWSRLAGQAKKVVDSRGGTDGLKRDAERLREIATGKGTAKDKAKRAADHLKQSPDEPGKPGGPTQPHDPTQPGNPDAGR